MQERITRAAQVICQSKRTLALTGAGISVESGIPDFRSRGGLWERFDPIEYATIEAFQADPKKVWQMLEEVYVLLDRLVPTLPTLVWPARGDGTAASHHHAEYRQPTPRWLLTCRRYHANAKTLFASGVISDQRQ